VVAQAVSPARGSAGIAEKTVGKGRQRGRRGWTVYD
jgi:hypothetical protein